MINAILIGCGQVAISRILPAVRLLADEEVLTISHVVDVFPYRQIASSISELLPKNPIYHQIAATSGALANFLALERLAKTPVIVATPTPWHAEHGCAALAASCPVALEKPLGSSVHALDQLADCLARSNGQLLFPLGYYLIEKGLPLLALARSGQLTPTQIRCLGGIQQEQWATLRDRLGSVRKITGVLIEGPDARPWVLSSDAGGHTLETFSHLVALSLPALGALAPKEVVFGYTSEMGGPRTESVMYAEFVGPGGERVRLGCQKGCPPTMCDRWLRIDYDNGSAMMDLERQRLTIASGGKTWTAHVSSQVKYEPQLRMFVEKLARPDLPTEYETGRKSVLISLAVRELGVRRGLQALPSTWLNDQFRRDT